LPLVGQPLEAKIISGKLTKVIDSPPDVAFKKFYHITSFTKHVKHDHLPVMKTLFEVGIKYQWFTVGEYGSSYIFFRLDQGRIRSLVYIDTKKGAKKRFKTTVRTTLPPQKKRKITDTEETGFGTWTYGEYVINEQLIQKYKTYEWNVYTLVHIDIYKNGQNIGKRLNIKKDEDKVRKLRTYHIIDQLIYEEDENSGFNYQITIDGTVDTEGKMAFHLSLIRQGYDFNWATNSLRQATVNVDGQILKIDRLDYSNRIIRGKAGYRRYEEQLIYRVPLEVVSKMIKSKNILISPSSDSFTLSRATCIAIAQVAERLKHP